MSSDPLDPSRAAPDDESAGGAPLDEPMAGADGASPAEPPSADVPAAAALEDLLASTGPDDTLDALNTLEALLVSRRGGEVEAPAETSTPAIESDGQYNIPLLDEVVLPGQEDLGPALPVDPPVVLSPVAQRLFDRLASEIDVIVQTGVDEALKAAAKNIRARVKQHVAIVLPEILDELSQEDD